MNKEGRPEGAAHHLTEAKRAQDFKHERTGLIEIIGQYCSRVASEKPETATVDVTDSPDGTKVTVKIENEGDSKKRTRYAAYDEAADANKLYDTDRKAEVIASYYEVKTYEGFGGDKTQSSEGWEVRGDGSVRRLVVTQDGGETIKEGIVTNDVLDLIEANEILRGVIKESFSTDTTA